MPNKTKIYEEFFPHKRVFENKALNAEVVQVITALKFAIFLTPNMASQNNVRHGIGLSYHWLVDGGIVFWRHLWRHKADKTLYPHTLAQLRQTRNI